MKYSIDEIFTYEILEVALKNFCITHYEIAEEQEVRDALKTILEYMACPGEDYDGLFD